MYTYTECTTLLVSQVCGTLHSVIIDRSTPMRSRRAPTIRIGDLLRRLSLSPPVSAAHVREEGPARRWHASYA
jgi:hypothetical protein